MSRHKERPQRAEGAVAPPTPTDRIRVITELMELGAWGPTSTYELAERWGLAPNTIQHDAVEASRIVRNTVANNADLVEELRGIARGRMKAVARDILAAKQRKDVRTAMHLEKSAAEYLRILLTDTRAVYTPGGAAPRKLSIPEDELKLLLGAAGYELRKVDDGGEEE